MSERVFVVAEAGVNHNGNVSEALSLVDAAAQAGADAVKFQAFEPSLLAASAKGWSILEELALPRQDFLKISRRCESAQIEFFATPCDEPSLRFLVEEVGVRRIKIASCDLTNGPLLVAAGRTKLPLILSTGMASLAEVKSALGAVAFGRLGWDEEILQKDTWLAIGEALAAAQGGLFDDVAVLHCVSAYPAPLEQMNLRTIALLREQLLIQVGLSDHTMSIDTPALAVAAGATLIEKHLTLNSEAPGPDHASSLEPREFAFMVCRVRFAEMVMGEKDKRPQPCEIKNGLAYRRSLRTTRPIANGEMFSPANMAALRPADGGLSPMLYWRLMGQRASRNYNEGELV